MTQQNKQHIHLIGFGSQGSAWAEILLAKNWTVDVYLPNSKSASYANAEKLGLKPQSPNQLPLNLKPGSSETIVFLIPDSIIGSFYREYLSSVEAELTLVLGHGYAVYNKDLVKVNPLHDLCLLAPKSIGPQLKAKALSAQKSSHDLVAAFHSPQRSQKKLLNLATALGFSENNLVPATFEQEAIGDLISEQILLCGGVFSLLEQTMKAMINAGIPPRLIKEECLTELELITGLLRKKGPDATFKAISQAAQCGAISMRENLLRNGLEKLCATQAQNVLNGNFAKEFESQEWKKNRNTFLEGLLKLQNHLPAFSESEENSK